MLAILRYWYYALVPEEKNPGGFRHVIRDEVIARYKVCFNIEGVLWNLTGNLDPWSTWRKNFEPILVVPKRIYSSKCRWFFVLYPELELALYERFIRRR